VTEQDYFQDFMPGDVCFGCGSENRQGLQIKSFWQGDISICEWQPQTCHQGWAGLTCGGVIATLVDCHCMATAMAHAIRSEGRELGSEPHYRFATGSLALRFIKPTPVAGLLVLHARVTDIKDERKYSLTCEVLVDDEITVKADVVAFLVWRSDADNESAFAGT